MSTMDDVLESWEEIEESGALDKKLDALQLNAVETLEEIESSSFKTNHSTNTRMIILGDDGMRSQYVPPKPAVKILKRPTRDSQGSGDGPLVNGDKPKQPIKTLKQREQEYAEARKRILGEEKSPEEKLEQEISRIQPKSITPSCSGLPNNVLRMPIGPDGTRGFNLKQADQRINKMGKMKDISTDEDTAVETNEVSPQKRHKKHKHKKHKKKKPTHDESDSFNDTAAETEKKKTFRVKMKKDDDKSSEKPREKLLKSSNLSVAGSSTAPSPKATTKKKIPKSNKGKDSGTSSEEERWLDAIESGKLEEVDDELKKIKPKDPKLMTARQRAMFERKTDTEPNPGVEQLMSLPTGYKEKVMTAEAIQKAALKSLKRKQLADEKREKDKKKTMERLLKKQESKASKVISKGKPSRRQVPLVTYRLTLERSSISLPPGENFPLQPTKGKDPPSKVLCGVNQCKNPKKYSCSKTGVPLCSLECYKTNLAIST